MQLLDVYVAEGRLTWWEKKSGLYDPPGAITSTAGRTDGFSFNLSGR